MKRKPGSPEWRAHVAKILAEEALQPMGWWYLSFVDEQFLGACVVQARGMAGAIRRSHELGINPGGEVMAIKCPEKGPGPLPVNKLLSRAELEAIDAKWKKMQAKEA